MLAYNAFYGRRCVAVNDQPQSALNTAKSMAAGSYSMQSDMKSAVIARNVFHFAQSGRRFIYFLVVTVVVMVAVVIAVVIPGEQVRHDFGVVVAGMVQAWKPESTFDCFEQREVRVTNRALQTADSVVRVHDRQHLVDIGGCAVIVFVPEKSESLSPSSGWPGRRHRSRPGSAPPACLSTTDRSRTEGRRCRGHAGD